MSVLPEVAGCGGCAASVRIDWMAEEIGPGCHFGVVACEKCGLIRFAVAAESAEALAAGRAHGPVRLRRRQRRTICRRTLTGGFSGRCKPALDRPFKR
ncbi:MAG: hypothetical protein V9H25_07335 [Candidatus Competibacter sp.]